MTPEFFAVYPAMTRIVDGNRWPRKVFNETLGFEVLRRVAHETDVLSSMILSDDRDVRTMRSRRMVMCELRDGHGWTVSAIGKFMSRDHSTVCSALGTLKRNKRLQRPPIAPILME